MTDEAAMSMEHPLSDMDVVSFREYAIENRTEPDGTQCQWADYTIRALDELVALRAKCQALQEQDEVHWKTRRTLLRELTRCQEENTREVERRQFFERQKEEYREQVVELVRERDELKGAMKADDERLRAAEEKVWPGRTWGCDAPEMLADEILGLRLVRDELKALAKKALALLPAIGSEEASTLEMEIEAAGYLRKALGE